MFAVYEPASDFLYTVWGTGRTKREAIKEALELLESYVKGSKSKKHYKIAVAEKRLIKPLVVQKCTEEFSDEINGSGGCDVYFIQGKNEIISDFSSLKQHLQELTHRLHNLSDVCEAENFETYKDTLYEIEEVVSYMRSKVESFDLEEQLA